MIDTFRTVHDTRVIALDGTWYFSSKSENSNCDNFKKIEHKNGEITHYHFIFVCKPKSHKHLYQQVDILEPNENKNTKK